MLVREISEKNNFAITPIPLFLSSYAINLIISIITVVVMAMIGKLYNHRPEGPATAQFGEANRSPASSG